MIDLDQQKCIELYYSFPAVFRNKLLNKEISFPDGTLFQYDKFCAYRGIIRDEQDHTPLNKDDMKSYYELYLEKGKCPRGRSIDLSDPSSYSVSLFRDFEDLKNIFKFPRPRKKVAVGCIFAEGGPQKMSTSTSHVDWWLFENVDFSNFEVLENNHE